MACRLRTVAWLLAAGAFVNLNAQQEPTPARRVSTPRGSTPANQKPGAPAPSAQGLSVSNVAVGAQSFNPSSGARVNVKVFDPDRRLVRTLVNAAPRRAGTRSETWDGRDVDGKVVPNEAYFFTIEATDSSNSIIVYDPVTFSGGEFADVTQGQLDRDVGTLSYKLSQPSRVLLRAGMATGLLLKTIVDWAPRPAGTVTEYWNGKDDEALFDIPSMKGTTMVLTYMTLPENSVITFGNAALTYRSYSAAVGARRPRKEDRPMANARRI
jgi:hypothetical protein